MYLFKERNTPHREPWNKGKLTGQKPPLQPKNVWAIRTRLQIDNRILAATGYNFRLILKWIRLLLCNFWVMMFCNRSAKTV